MRILQISDLAPPHVGGVEKVVWNYSKMLSYKGFDVTLLTSLLPGTKREETVNGVRIKRVRKPILSFPFYFDKDFDVIHTHSYFSYYSIGMERKFKKKAFLKHVHIIYGNLVTDFMGWDFVKISSLMERSLLLAGCTAYIVPSEYLKGELLNLGVRSNIHVLPHGREFENFPDKNSARERLGIDKNKKIIGFVGRLVKGKGVLDIIEIWNEIIKEHSDAVLLIVGPNPSKNVSGIKGIMDEIGMKIKNLHLERNVIITGEISDNILPYYLSSMDIFVSPTYRESFGLSILNAMSAGLPVIAYNNSSIPELIDENSGILVPTGDKTILKNAILKLLSDDDLAAKMGRNARISAQKYSWENSVNNLISIYYNYL